MLYQVFYPREGGIWVNETMFTYSDGLGSIDEEVDVIKFVECEGKGSVYICS